MLELSRRREGAVGTDRLSRTAAATAAARLHTVLFKVGPISMAGPWVQIGLESDESKKLHEEPMPTSE